MAKTSIKGSSNSLHDKSAREKLEIELYRLESIVVEKLIPYGLQAERGKCLYQFTDPPTEVHKYQFDPAQFLTIARKVTSDPEVSYDDKMAAGMGFVLQEIIWKDFHKDRLSWNFAWLVAALAGANPTPPADQRVQDPLITEIESLIPDAWRGKKVHDAAKLGAAERSATSKIRRKDWQERADRLFQANPNLSIRNAALRIEQDLGRSPDNSSEAIRKVIKNPS